MTLWPPELFPYLPGKRLSAFHRDLCYFRGRGWGKGGPDMRRVWLSNLATIHAYHGLVIAEMRARNWHPSPSWDCATWRGVEMGHAPIEALGELRNFFAWFGPKATWDGVCALAALLPNTKLWKPEEVEKFTKYMRTFR